ncbi:TPA: hypothetical protein DIC20_00120 [Candidatus Dependentiae bacterium]|nr:MAG: hypothetical protein US03_C0012G0010 [candidate division TM6 bacterium GW2011_GWF2_36_131]KKQ02590.1 MAG: hypothetical protein US13_C0013G0012 [candidate division TM6 bacterium GW2011_GWE2_36_25]KKQ19085.1 MAG: hypothetical protein US32_C0016G0011 [candidate division TM6 bacterium GW2011_GWA2_36_9]HBR70175.1 hypothetical protein [Candidatus Dependentiae bacterium]HCU00093.1 hypothetical protein [Candidatus Dependentiae bacterium]
MKSKFFLIVLIVIGTSAVLNAAQAFGPCLTYNSCTSCCGNCNTNDCPCGYPIACYNGNSPTGSFCCSYSDGCGCASCGDCEYCCLEGCYCNYGHTWFSQRDQGTNQCEVISFTFDKRHKFGDEFYGDFAITLGYQQNFNRYRLSSYFFNKNGLMRIGGNAPDGRTAMVDVRASDLGLSSTFTGTAWLCPKYHDFILDLDLFMAWDNLVEGLWTELRVPFINSTWNAGLGTSSWYEGGTTYTTPVAVGNISANQVVNIVNDESTVTKVIYQGNCGLTGALLGNVGFGDAPRLNAGKLINCSRSTSGLGGIRLSIGYDFLRRERGFLGIGLDFEFPAANKPHKNNCCCDLYLFEPKIGSQHQYLIGGIFLGEYQLKQWENNHKLTFIFDARGYASFKGCTTRMLGLIANGNTLFNHYLLLKKYSVSGSTATYAGLERAANLLKARVKAKTTFEGDITLLLNYQKDNLLCGIGYNFYGRAKEELCSYNLCNCDDYYYVIKGDAPVANAALTQDGGFFSPNDSDINQTGTLVTGSQGTWNQLNSTIITNNAIQFTTANGNLRLCVAEHPTYLSHTFFVNIGYNWSDTEGKPYVGLIGKVDLGIDNTALRLWGIYLKGGFCF